MNDDFGVFWNSIQPLSENLFPSLSKTASVTPQKKCQQNWKAIVTKQIDNSLLCLHRKKPVISAWLRYKYSLGKWTTEVVLFCPEIPILISPKLSQGKIFSPRLSLRIFWWEFQRLLFAMYATTTTVFLFANFQAFRCQTWQKFCISKDQYWNRRRDSRIRSWKRRLHHPNWIQVSCKCTCNFHKSKRLQRKCSVKVPWNVIYWRPSSSHGTVW